MHDTNENPYNVNCSSKPNLRCSEWTLIFGSLRERPERSHSKMVHHHLFSHANSSCPARWQDVTQRCHYDCWLTVGRACSAKVEEKSSLAISAPRPAVDQTVAHATPTARYFLHQRLCSFVSRIYSRSCTGPGVVSFQKT